jgi:FO synthase
MATVVSANAMRRALRRAQDGAALDATEAEILLAARGPDLEQLTAAAARQRDQGLTAAGRPRTITYSRKVFVPLTRLCRDRCHYCTFATTPAKLAAAGEPLFLEPEQVVGIAAGGAALGCKEALFTLGDRPEDRWPAARSWLEERGYSSTLDYLRAMAIRVLEETGLLPHLNPGVMTWAEMTRLKPVAPSMGLMLETSAVRLWAEPGSPHYGSPDKEPARRLRVLEDAGRLAVPFTSGILVGIGETPAERVESLFDLRRIARLYGSLQEVIVQNFRAKPATAMAHTPDADLDDFAATVAVARLLLGPKMRLQAPPNLAGDRFEQLLAAGIDDWGGVSPLTPDHVNPERPWPRIEALAERCRAAGFDLVERLTVYPRYVRAGEPWIDPRVMPHVAALADPVTGLADPRARPVGRPHQEPDGGLLDAGRTDLHSAVDTEGRAQDRRGDFASVYGDWAELALSRRPPPVVVGDSQIVDDRLRTALRRAAGDPGALSDGEALALLGARGAALEELCGLADDLRRRTVGDTVTYVVNRNINFTNICYVGCRFCAFAQRRTDPDAYSLSLEEIATRAQEAWESGATEVCLQGGIDPQLPATAYFDIAAAVKARVPGIHLHAFSPMEIASGAARTGLDYRDFLSRLRSCGVDTIPGTAAEILDDEVRWILTKGKLPAAEWVQIVSTAHEVGLRSSATMMYGHVDEPRHWVGHLRLLRELQERTGGFTEFVPLPFIHHNSPVYLAGLARPGPTLAENRAVHALARLLLAGRIDHVQCSWVKLGVEGCRTMLRGGADDLGGTLMEETISRMAGSEHGSRKSPEELVGIAAGIGRAARERSTVYGEVAVRANAGGPAPLSSVGERDQARWAAGGRR